MQYKKFGLIIYFISIFSSTFGQNNNQNINFASPVDIPIFLSGNFGEIRSTHFHAGIDIKTQGVIGKKIYAVEDGFISRIKVSINSYGKTIYIAHPNGYTTVYGHLNNFIPEIDNFVKNLQYKNEKFEINYFPNQDQFIVKKGDLIGFSGNTGSSLGPHLHFEVRETNNQIPVNPLLFNFDIEDKLPPVLYNFVIYPLGRSSHVNQSKQKKSFELRKHNGTYSLVDTNHIYLSGQIGFGIEMYDYLNGSKNRCGIHTLSLLIDSTLIYQHAIDKFSFYEASFVKGHIDYAEKVKSRKTIQKMFISPNNNLSIYKTNKNKGVFIFQNDITYKINLIVTDTYGNKSELSFFVTGTEPNFEFNEKISDDGKLMNWDQENSYENEEIKVQIPGKALFDTINFKYAMKEPEFKAYSSLHHVHNIYTPVLKPYSLTIKTKNLPGELKEKAFIAEIYNDEINSIGGSIINGHIVGQARSFGDFVVLVDIVSPIIKPLSDFSNLNRGVIKFKITDKLTGIKSFNGYIDNKWALFEFDQKNDLLFYTIDKERVEKGIEHELELFVIDNMDNIATYYTTFYW